MRQPPEGGEAPSGLNRERVPVAARGRRTFAVALIGVGGQLHSQLNARVFVSLGADTPAGKADYVNRRMAGLSHISGSRTAALCVSHTVNYTTRLIGNASYK